MAGEWRTSTWGEEISLQYGKALRGHNTALGRYRVFGSNGPIGWTSEPLALGPGVILGRKGAYRGVQYSSEPFFVIDTAYYVVPKSELDMRWLYYAIKHYKLGKVDDGSPIPSTTRAAVYMLDMDVPSPPEQRAIAHILGTLDDKIELNRRTNETLEAMARALFKSWFVDFDPVRAKSKNVGWVSPKRSGGRNPTNGAELDYVAEMLGYAALTQPTAGAEAAAGAEGDPGNWRWPNHVLDLFPDSFEDSDLGEIPMGWEVGCVDDEFALTMGQSPPGETYNELGEGVPFYQGRTDFGSRFPTRRVFCTAPTRRAKTGDTLISVRAPVGDINMASENCAIGRGVAAARHKSGSRSYSYQFMLGLEEVFARFEAEGTVFGSIGKKDFHAIPCAKPPQEVVAAFESMLSPVDGRIDITERESRTLAALRDTLLPKLISGEMRVKDAERCIENVQ
jgi:type I restriction enzyme S subunit